jgi:CheY-like chemotaxis protein
VILLDVMMPDMNGFEFLTRAATQLAFAETRVVLMTAFTPRDGAVCGARIPAGIPLLTKPFDHGTLVSEITRAARAPWAAARVEARGAGS